MSMVSLTIAPLLRDDNKIGNEDWENWHFGIIPFGVFVAVTFALAYKGILTWKDPLAKEQSREPAKDDAGSKAPVDNAATEIQVADDATKELAALKVNL